MAVVGLEAALYAYTEDLGVATAHFEYVSDAGELGSSAYTSTAFPVSTADLLTIASPSSRILRVFQTAETSIALDLSALALVAPGICERLSVTPSVFAPGTFGLSVLERVKLIDKIRAAYDVLLSEKVSATSSLSFLVLKTSSLVERLGVTSGQEVVGSFLASISLAFSIMEETGAAKSGQLEETIYLSDEAFVRADYYLSFLEHAIMSPSAERGVVGFVLATDEVGLASQPSGTATLRAGILDGLTFAVNFGIGGQVYSGWVMNTKNFAVSEYQGYPFNSFCYAHGKYLGANENGIYELTGGTDAGEDIQSTLRLGVTDFNLPNRKIIDSVYLGFRADGTMLLKTIADDHTELLYEVDKTEGRLHRRRIHPMAKGLKAVYWQFELANVNGADFELSEIEFFPVIMKRTV